MEEKKPIAEFLQNVLVLASPGAGGENLEFLLSSRFSEVVTLFCEDREDEQEKQLFSDFLFFFALSVTKHVARSIWTWPYHPLQNAEIAELIREEAYTLAARRQLLRKVLSSVRSMSSSEAYFHFRKYCIVSIKRGVLTKIKRLLAQPNFISIHELKLRGLEPSAESKELREVLTMVTLKDCMKNGPKSVSPRAWKMFLAHRLGGDVHRVARAFGVEANSVRANTSRVEKVVQKNLTECLTV